MSCATIGGSALIYGAVTEPQHHVVTPEQLATANDLSSAFRNVGRMIEPSVVNIIVHKTVKSADETPLNDDSSRRFPERSLPNSPDQRNEQGNDQDQDSQGSLDQVGMGSGVIMEVDGNVGYILTNNHVAGDASEISVTLADGRRIDNAKLVGADPKSDLAVIRINAGRLVPARWGDSSTLHQGDWVMAFGSPFGYVGSMTHGIVSALDRNNVGILGAGGYEDFIQVDVPINPGNSGGPLVNLSGEVVGINAAIASRTGAFSGIGFAIPVNEARFVYCSLMEHGKVVRGWLGVSIADISSDPKVAASFGYTRSNGVLIESTLANSPASGKLEAGDIIESINGKPVENVLQLRNAVAADAPDAEIKFTVWRKNQETPVAVKLGTQPQDISLALESGSAQSESATNALGMTLSDVTDNLARQFNLGDDHQGALVTHVKHRSAAEMAGVRPGEMITQIEGNAVKNAAEAGELLSKRDVKKGVRLYVTSPQGDRFVFIAAN
jgi:serine protease Do